MATSSRACPSLLRPIHAVFVLLGTCLLLITLFKEFGSPLRQSYFHAPSALESDQLDLGQYIHVSTVSDEELNFADPSRRVIFVGDVHGMASSFEKLLGKVEYNPNTDFLIHTGDIVGRGPLSGSLEALSAMIRNNITGVRGNHDQKVIEWRAWIDNVLSKEGGAEWLEGQEQQSPENVSSDNKSRKRIKHWQKVPKGWEMNGSQYKVARHMTTEEHDYLRSLPFVLHIPGLHALVVHAGLVPLDLNLKETSPLQPLAHVPSKRIKNEDVLRRMQELAIVRNISHNRDPWVLTNMRSIRKDNKISRKAKFLPWPTLWNSVVSRCEGFEVDADSSAAESDNPGYAYETPLSGTTHEVLKKKGPLPCNPVTVVYGHIAKMGLDIQRWSKGLDTGCVYGRRLTALIVSPPNSKTRALRSDDGAVDEDGVVDQGHKRKEDRARKVPFGDRGMASTQMVSVTCPKPQ